MPLCPRWKIECDRLAKKSIEIAHANLRELGTPRCQELFKESIELMKQSRALMDATKPPEPPPKNPLLDSFAKGKGFMPPPTRPPDAPFNSVVLHAFEQSKANSSGAGPSQPAAISTEHVSGKGVLPPRREPSDYEQVNEKELDSYIAAQGPTTTTATTPAASPKSPSEILRNDMQTASLKAEEHLCSSFCSILVLDGVQSGFKLRSKT
eukprot:1136116-Pleurochrysis_carterae.AAC.1